MDTLRKVTRRLRAKPGKKISLKDFDAAWSGGIKDKEKAAAYLARGVRQPAVQQSMLYAPDTHSVLLIFQAMDAAGKDGTIRRVMSGINPQGCQVYSFKAPSTEERDHTYLWRSMKALPERGRIGIHNRSHYEEVLVPRVRPDILAAAQLPDHLKDGGGLEAPIPRDQQLRSLSRGQRDGHPEVLPARVQEGAEATLPGPHRRGRQELEVLGERREGAHALERVHARVRRRLTHTSTDAARWHIVPADKKWFTRLAVSAITVEALEDLKPAYPKVTTAKKKELAQGRRMLMAEKE